MQWPKNNNRNIPLRKKLKRNQNCNYKPKIQLLPPKVFPKILKFYRAIKLKHITDLTGFIFFQMMTSNTAYF